MEEFFTTHQVANMAQIHRDTLLRWLRDGRVTEPVRNRNGWRLFTKEEAERVVKYAQTGQSNGVVRESTGVYSITPISKLKKIDWDFARASTGYLTHLIHPYPAKFIPQIPNALIQELSSVGEIVLDPFCGSGTTLVEAMLLKRFAIGVDANPLACLISRAKTTRVDEDDVQCLYDIEKQANDMADQQYLNSLPLFPEIKPVVKRPQFDGIDFWFLPYVIDELSVLKEICLATSNTNARDIALTAFSSIIVGVSKQDSDTRYVRREKDIKPGETIQRFVRALNIAIRKAIEFTELTEPNFTRNIIYSDVLAGPNVDTVDLVVCSPPYPNAYSYHLYHRTRMLWLDMDQPTFKKLEIGSHRKYSLKGSNMATAETFRAELEIILKWLKKSLRLGGYACFVIGNSRVKGQIIFNDKLLIEAGEATGFRQEANLIRHLQDSKKSFNPSIGTIKDEHIVVLQNIRG